MNYPQRWIKTVMAAGAAAILCLGAPLAVAQQAPSANPVDPGNLSGVWMRSGGRSTLRFTARERAILTAEGERPPLRPEALALLEKRLKASDEGEAYSDSVSQCLPGGVPKTEFYGATPMQIITERDQVTILFEELNHFRIIALNTPHNPDPDPSYNGDSTGRWEGDTLVVDTIGLNDKTTLDAAGTPHSARLHVTERFRRIDKDTLELVATIDDPETFTRPWNAKTLFKIQAQKLQEYICDNNRNTLDPGSGLQGFSNTPLAK